MADNNIDFLIKFNAAADSLKNVRKDVESALSGVSISTKKVVTSSRGQGASGLQSGISKLSSKLLDKNADLFKATDRLANAEEKLAALLDKKNNATEEEIAEIKNLRKERSNAQKQIRRNLQAWEKLGIGLGILRQDLDEFAGNVRAAAGTALLGPSPTRDLLPPRPVPFSLPSADDVRSSTDASLKNVEFFKNAEGLGLSINRLKESVGKNRRILENAGVAQSALAEELLGQADAIRQRSSTDNPLTNAQLELISQLRRSAEALNSKLNRPLEPLSDRARQLSLQFGSTASDVARLLNPQATAAELQEATSKYRAALESAGFNIQRAAQDANIIGEGEGLVTSRQFTDAVEASLRQQEKETLNLANSSKQLADATGGEASKLLRANAASAITEATKDFKSALKFVGDSFRGVGRLAATTEGGFADLPKQLGRFKKLLSDSISKDEITALKDIGVNVDEILEGFIRKAGESFVKEFSSKSEELSRQFLRVSVDDLVSGKIDVNQIESILVNRFGKTTAEAAESIASLQTKANEIVLKESKKSADARKKEREQRDALASKLADVKKRVLQEEERLIDAISNSIRAEQQSARLRGQRATGPSSTVPESARADDLANFGKQLNTRQQEIFVSLLQKGEVNLQRVNTQLKAHQGNIGRSNGLVSELTRTFTSGQRAAFQFGFAASNAAERLAAWASPAAFIFAATNSLREAVQRIIQLDTEIARIAFFDADTLDKIAAGIESEGVALRSTASEAEAAKGAFDRLNTSTERLRVLNEAAARSQQLLIARAKETGIELSKLSEIALVAGRVGKQAFDDAGSITPFAKAVEGIVRLEGASADAADITAKLNSVLNQFGLESQDATVLAAQLTEASRRTAFGAAELAEGLTRVAGAFSTLQTATPQQTLEFLATAGNTAQVSVSKVGTALRQFSVGVAKAAKDVKEFSGLDIVDADGLLKGPEALVDVLNVISTFEGSEAAIEFIKQFTDERNASIILSLARGSGELATRLEELAEAGGEASAKQRALLGFLAAVDAQSATLSSKLERVKASVTELVATSGFIDFLSTGASVINSVVNGGTALSNVLGGFTNIFSLLAATAIPVLQKIREGFIAGFLGKQQLAEVQNKFIIALNEEKNLVEASRIAAAERLITQKEATAFQNEAVAIAVKKFAVEKDIAILATEISLIEKSGIKTGTELNALLDQRKVKEQELLAIKKSEELLSKNIAANTQAGINKQSGFFGNLINPDNLTRLVVGAFAVAGPAIGKELGGAIGGETGKEVEGAFKGLSTGVLLGSLFGPLGAVIGGLTGSIAGLVSAFNAADEAADRQLATQIELSRTIRRQRQIQQDRDDARILAIGRISKAQVELNQLQDEQEIINLRINKAKDGTAEKNKLLEKSEENQVRIDRLLLQQKKLQAAEVERQLKFEERILDIKNKQNRLTSIGNLLQKAQIASLDDNSQRPILEVEIKTEANLRNLAITRQSIQEQLDAIELRIVQAEGQKGGADIVKKLQKDQKNLQNELLQLDIERADVLLDAAKETRDIRKKESEDEFSRFKSIGSLLRTEFKTFTDNQLKIVDIIGKQAGVFKELANNQEELAQNAARATPGGAINDITDLTIREQLRIIKVRNKIVEQGARETNRVFRQQIEGLGDIQSIEALTAGAKDISDRFAKLGGPIGQFSRNISLSEKALRQRLEVDRAAFEASRSITLKNLDINRQQIRAENDVARQKIALINEEIKVLQKRIDQETKIGEKLINTPEKLFDEIRKTFDAEQILNQVGANAGNIEESLLKIISKVGSTSGVAGLKPIFEGLRAAQENGVQLIAGVLPRQLADLFARLVANPNAKLQEARVSEQTKLINEIGGLITGIKANNKALLDVNAAQRRVQELLSSDKSSKEQIETIKSGFENQARILGESISAFRLSQENLVSVGDNINELKEDFLNAVDITEGDRRIESAVDRLARILEEIASADEKASARSTADAEKLAKQFRDELAKGITEQDIRKGEAEVRKSSRDRNNEIKRLSRLQQQAKEELARLRKLQNAANKINIDAAGPAFDFTKLPGIISGANAVLFGELVGNLGDDGGTLVDLSPEDKKAREVATRTLEELTQRLQDLDNELRNEAIPKATRSFQERVARLAAELEKLGIDPNTEGGRVRVGQDARREARRLADEARREIDNDNRFVFSEAPEGFGEDFGNIPLPPGTSQSGEEEASREAERLRQARIREEAERRNRGTFLDDDGNRTKLGAAVKDAVERAELDERTFVDPDGNRVDRGAARRAAEDELAAAAARARLDRTSFVDDDGNRIPRGSAQRAEEVARQARRIEDAIAERQAARRAALDDVSFVDDDGNRVRRQTSLSDARANAEKRAEEARARRIAESQKEIEAARARGRAEQADIAREIRVRDERQARIDRLNSGPDPEPESDELRRERQNRDELVREIIRRRQSGRDFAFEEGTDTLSDINPLARQIANMERILENARLNEGSFDESFLRNLERQINELKVELGSLQSPAQGAVDLEAARDEVRVERARARDRETRRIAAQRQVELERRQAEERRARETRDAEAASRRRPEAVGDTDRQKPAAQTDRILESNRETNKANKENTNKVTSSVGSVGSKVEEMQRAVTSAISTLNTAITNLGSIGSGGTIKIDEASREEFCQCIKDAIQEAMQEWIDKFILAVEEGSLDVRISPIELLLQANVVSVIQGETFADQLVEALIGTGLEDRVNDIQEALSEILSLEQERTGRLGNGGARVLDQAGSTNGTTTSPRFGGNTVTR